MVRDVVVDRVARGNAILAFIDRRLPIVLLGRENIARPVTDTEWSLTPLPAAFWYIAGRKDAVNLYDSSVVRYRFGPEGLRAASAKEPLESPYFAQDEGECLYGVMEREEQHYEYRRIAKSDAIACARLPEGARAERVLHEADGKTGLLLNTGDGGPSHPSTLVWARSATVPVRLQVGRSFNYILSDVDANGMLVMMMRSMQSYGADLVLASADRSGRVSQRVLDRERTDRTCPHVSGENTGSAREECALHEIKLYPIAMHIGRQGSRFAYVRTVVDAREECTEHRAPCDPAGPGPYRCAQPERSCQRSSDKARSSLFIVDGTNSVPPVLERDGYMDGSGIGFDAEGKLHAVLWQGTPSSGEFHYLLIGPRSD